MRKKRRKKLHPTGQLSIFAVLMFQMLFILFAMSLNVALVVHDKINLQNSVDLAAYYGAMKQAEMMNAIAHINYQIRQSWKLFVWRYRVLGNIGVAHTRASPMTGTRGQARIIRPICAGRPCNSHGAPGPYFFCVGHRWWGVFDNNSPAGISMPDSRADNSCLDMVSSINAISIPDVRGVLGGYYNLMVGTRAVSIDINNIVSRRCSLYAYNSWLLGVFSVIHFRRDQSVRKYMIKKLAETIQAGKDLDGGSIGRGVENTFRKNLNFINGKNARPLKQFNSLDGTKGVQVNHWLTDAHHKVNTNVLYAKLDAPSVGGCDKTIEYLQHPPNQYRLFITDAKKDELVNEIHYSGYNWPSGCTTENQCDPSAGISKNPDFYVFYAVEAELDYKNQIFLPGGRDLKLKAQAFAKPFGGRIGPPENADRILNDSGSWGPFTLPNYSRYPGDRIGLRSSYTQHQWGFIQGVGKMQKNVLNYKKKESPNDPDPLMRTRIGGGGDGRRWEMKAIAPDLFDVSYFTILPYYQHTYFKKVKALVGIGNRARGDLGYVGTDVGYGTFFQSESLLNQINKPSSSNPQFRNFRPFYKIQNDGNRPDRPALLLTGWNPPQFKYRSADSYGTNRPTNFGKCHKWANSTISQPKGKIANGCVYGGRSGYSVKMISRNYIDGFSRQDNPRIPSTW